MMPYCDYERRFLFGLIRYRCRRVAAHLHVDRNDYQVAGCDKHEAWYRQQVTNDLEAQNDQR